MAMLDKERVARQGTGYEGYDEEHESGKENSNYKKSSEESKKFSTWSFDCKIHVAPPVNFSHRSKLVVQWWELSGGL